MNTDRDQVHCLPEAAVHCLTSIGTRVEVNSGDEFIHEGEFDETIFLVVEGTVEVRRGGEVVGTIEEGDVVGEIAFIDRRPRTASVVASTATVLVKAKREDLLRELGRNPDLLVQFVQALEVRRSAHLTTPVSGGVDEFLKVVTEEAVSHRAVNHPYLLALRNKELPDMKWALADFARQYNGYSSHFPRYLTTVIGRLELPEHRSALMENLTEESGIYEQEELDELKDIGVDPQWVDGVPHPVLFSRFCKVAGVETGGSDSDCIEVMCWREMFLSVLSGGSTAEALGALGLGTENVVSTMYQHFLPALDVLEAPPSETVFFPLHAAVDDHHQETLLDISRHYAQDEAGRIDLLKGMRKALALRAGFWDWLYQRALSGGTCDRNSIQRFVH